MRLARVVSISLGASLLLASTFAYAPAVVGAVAASVVFELLAVEAGIFLAALAAGATSLVIGRALSPGRQQGLPTFQAEAKDRQTVVRSPVEPRRIVYGRVAVSGPLIYTESTGTDNEFLHLVIALADHEVEEIGDVYFNDEKLPLNDDGLAMGKWAHTRQEVSTYEAAIPSSPFQLTVPETVRSVSRVYILAGGIYPEGFDQVYLIQEVPANNIETIYQYSRSGSVFTFHPALADSFQPGLLGITYTIKIEYFGEAIDGSYVRVKKHLGTAGQVADPDLVAESGTGSPAAEGRWTSDHKLSGIAYLYVRLEFSHDIFPTGIPNIKAVVLGKKLYDPRVGGSPQTGTWSDNWALVMRDYLTSSYGLDCDDDEIDDDLIIAAANISDELVDTGFGSPNIGTQKRYTANGTVNLADRPVDILKTLASGGAGAVVFAEGEWRVFAGAYDTPTIEIDEDWLRGAVKIRAKPPRRELFNSVRGVFADADRFWQPTDFPPVTNSTYATQDGGQEIFRDIELPFTTEAFRAQRIAKIHLETGRQGIVVELPCNMKAFQLNVWDTVMVSIDRLGWDQKVFRVIDWKFAPSGGVDLVLREEASEVYDWNAGDATMIDFAPDTSLASALEVTPPTSIVVSYSQDSNRVIVSWTASVDPFVSLYQVEYKLTSESEYTVLPVLRGTSVDLGNLVPEEYDIRVKAINTLGVSSTYAEIEHVIGVGVDVGTYPILGSILVNTWTEQTNPTINLDLNGICWSGARFVAVGEAQSGSPSSGAYIVTSLDGITWTQRNNPLVLTLNDVCVGDVGSPEVTRLVAVGVAYIATSDDHGVTWNSRTNPSPATLNAVAWSESLARYVAVGNAVLGSPTGGSGIVSSSDGITWTSHSNPGNVVLNDIAWSPELGLFCAVGQNLGGSPLAAKIITSTDGFSWSLRSNTVDTDLHCVTWSPDDSLFIAGGLSGTIITSPDGINWTARESVASWSLNGAADWNGSINVIVGTDIIISSSDGINWESRDFTNPNNAALTGIAWNGKVFVAVGTAPTSEDAFMLRSLPVS
jgi:hypothetical protein